MYVSLGYVQLRCAQVIGIMLVRFEVFRRLLVEDPPLHGFVNTIVSQHFYHRRRPTATPHYPHRVFRKSHRCVYSRILDCYKLMLLAERSKWDTQAYVRILMKTPLNSRSRGFILYANQDSNLRPTV